MKKCENTPVKKPLLVPGSPARGFQKVLELRARVRPPLLPALSSSRPGFFKILSSFSSSWRLILWIFCCLASKCFASKTLQVIFLVLSMFAGLRESCQSMICWWHPANRFLKPQNLHSVTRIIIHYEHRIDFIITRMMIMRLLKIKITHQPMQCEV